MSESAGPIDEEQQLREALREAAVRYNQVTGRPVLIEFPDPPTVEQRLSSVEAVLRANEMHEGGCALRQTRESQRDTSMYLIEPPCDCWLRATP